MRFSSFSILLFFIVLVLSGLALIPKLNVALRPTKQMQLLQVNYYLPNASPRVVEQEVTSKLEGVFSMVKGVKNISSESSQNRGTIYIELKKEVDIDAVRFELSTIIRQIYNQLPENLSYPLIRSVDKSKEETEEPILTYTLNANVSPYFIQKYAEEFIIPKISLTAGVKTVEIYGANPFQWLVEYDIDACKNTGISGGDISNSLSSFFNKKNLGLADISFNNVSKKTMTVILQNQTSKKIDWHSIPIKNVNGKIIYLSDIAKVKFTESKPNAYFRINGLNTVNILIYANKGQNALKLASKIRKQMELLKSNLNDGYYLMLVNDNTISVQNQLNKIFLRTIMSLLFLFLFVLIATRHLKYLWFISASLVVNLALATILYKLFDIEIHLYSLAGITISFGIIIDNSIMMIHHLQTKGDKRVFIAIFAATLTTIGALSIIFLLNDDQKAKLLDFADVIIINLSVSLLVALFFIPALFDKYPFKPNNFSRQFHRKRRIVVLSHLYEKFILKIKRFKAIPIIILILVFGIPFNFLPEKIEKESKFADFYNKSFGSDWFIDSAKPFLIKYLGGTIKNFSEYIKDNSYFGEPGRARLYVLCKMPEGSSIEQTNTTISEMEKYLAGFDKIEMFKTNINNNRYGKIEIFFKKRYENTSFPYELKNLLIKKAINLGGTDWNIYGVGKSFSNAVNSGFKSEHIGLKGYNYDQLFKYAELLRKKILKDPKVSEVDISGEYSWFTKKTYEYVLIPDNKKFALYNMSLTDIYLPLSNILYSDPIAFAAYKDNFYPVVLKSSLSQTFDLWNLNNYPLIFGNKYQKIKNLTHLEFRQVNSSVIRKNQVYQLVLNYNYSGSQIRAKNLKKKMTKYISEKMPIGFKCIDDFSSWGSRSKRAVILLLIILLIIYFICSILFESFNAPLSIIMMIPVSFIGIFITFTYFNLTFDQGGFSSFILLSGITVNAGIYLINHFNKYSKKRNIKNYVKAFNYKIIPIILTILSTILGLIPFLVYSKNETFWFSFAAGAIGGLVFSFISIIIYLPLFLKTEK